MQQAVCASCRLSQPQALSGVAAGHALRAWTTAHQSMHAPMTLVNSRNNAGSRISVVLTQLQCTCVHGTSSCTCIGSCRSQLMPAGTDLHACDLFKSPAQAEAWVYKHNLMLQLGFEQHGQVIWFLWCSADEHSARLLCDLHQASDTSLTQTHINWEVHLISW